MAKRIYIGESSVPALKNARLLPKFVYRSVKRKDTSLGDCPSIPGDEGFMFEYKILRDRMDAIYDAAESLGFDTSDTESMANELSSAVKRCAELERPIREILEDECIRCVDRMFRVPAGLVDLSVELVDSIKYMVSPRVNPDGGGEDYKFDDLDDKGKASESILKRRFVNALIQGAAYRYSTDDDLYYESIGKICGELPELYRRIRVLNDFLTFMTKENITDENLMQGSYVETSVGIGAEKTKIRAQGLIFPLLLQDAIRGLFELFASHGLPKDMDKARYIVGNADFVAAEPWDIRLGIGLWDRIFGGVGDSVIVPYMFTSLVKKPCDDFNLSMREILSGTKKGDEIMSEVEAQAEHDSGYQEFKDRISLKRGDKSVIYDSYFTAGDKGGYDLSSEDGAAEVIEEEGSDSMAEYLAEPAHDAVYYQNLVDSATVENIDFIEGDVNDGSEDLIVTIGGEVVPRTIILLMAQPVKIRVSETQRVDLLQIHIIMDKSVQHRGLAPKIYKKLILEFGGIYCGEGRRINKEHIGRVYEKLSEDPDLYVYHDDMCYIALPKSKAEEVGGQQ